MTPRSPKSRPVTDMARHVKSVPKEITVVWLEALLMPNGEVISAGWFKTFAKFLKQPEARMNAEAIAAVVAADARTGRPDPNVRRARQRARR